MPQTAVLLIRREKARYWLCRLYLCASVIFAMSVGLYDPTSQHSQGLNIQTFGGCLAVTYLFAACAIGLIDTIGHDLLGVRLCMFRNLRRFRFLWLMALATGLMILILVDVRWGYPDPVALRYAIDAIVASAIAVLDLRERMRQSPQ